VDGTSGQRIRADQLDGNNHLAKVRVDYVLGAKWLLRFRLLADKNMGAPSSAKQQAPPLQGR
jgi:hypothetical protein